MSNGSETSATSATGGVEVTVLTDFALSTPVRVRFGLSNKGATSTQAAQYQLEPRYQTHIVQ
ncbi:MAG: hypothetical protein R3B69_00545 [Candidatus Paceibacterota bacterium]